MIGHHARACWILMLLFVLSSAHGAWAGPPSDQLSAGIERVLKIIADPELEGDTKLNQRRAAIITVASETFKVDQRGAGKMTVHGEQVDGEYAVVRTTIPLSSGQEMPIDYRLHNIADRWRVYDLTVDGISLVANYRAQFNKIIRTSSYEALVARFRSQQAGLAPPKDASGAEPAR